ncbi:M64 family metallopeptidase [Carboxylicivirga sp. M1479]|uniref:M64 family metallopeptidase n=1 Tax=Carboxylicivirga sp. M1479 TaxID=2594476 RepID=UPI001177A895|nr:M64 family metallopeptidase [Carboxylicivirga sp. M1479]TRX63194.1 peptidase M64 [Carboxylicivirga sp. M1479]
MRKGLISVVCLVLLMTSACAQSVFEKSFGEKTMRVDLVLAGNKHMQTAYLLQLKKEPYWGGSQLNLIDSLAYGEFRFKVIDQSNDQLIYSRGFCTLFEEWRTTQEAQSLSKAFFQTLVFPYPKNNVVFVLEERKKNGSYHPLLSFPIDPDDKNIAKEVLSANEVVKVVDNGAAANNVDFTFVAEGYTLEQMDKFKSDVKRMADYLLSQEPYKSKSDRINVWAVCSPSKDSGSDDPRNGEWVNTAINSSFNTFYIDRYLETEDVLSIRDIAASAPYDHICVLVNSDKYGGGGIYNHFSIGTADHALSNEVMLHEIGHGFVGLADEYYTSDVAYQDFFDLTVEPWQPNVTTLVNFDSKWKHLLDKDTPIPTPNSKMYEDKVGVFEGGGYVEKGVYRPAVNCRMKTNQAEGFCPACQEAIKEMIDFVTDKK